MKQSKRIFTIVGTRPDGIKLAPVIRALKELEGIESQVVVTAQHRELLDRVLATFEVDPDHDLDLMRPGQELSEFASRAIDALGRLFRSEAPDFVLVQGDTTTAMAGALAGHFSGAEVGHVEAGLRSFDLRNPFPEEANRRIITQLADIHFAPTEANLGNLVREGVSADRIHVTGNSVIDALSYIATRVSLADLPEKTARLLSDGRRLILVTLHRRETFGFALEGICGALRKVIEDEDGVQVLFPVHPNPNVRRVVEAQLGGIARIHLVEPMDYVEFVAAMQNAYLILTDSGGVQEEAPTLGTPILVVRDTTERPEVVEIGAARLIGRDPQAVLANIEELMSDRRAYEAMTGHPNPFGDGHAGERIARVIQARLLASPLLT